MNKKFLIITSLTAALFAASCAGTSNYDYLDYDEIEQLALDSIMMNTYPDAYRQSDGFYVDPIDMSSKSGVATNEAECWIRFNITSRSLDGDVCNTRDASVAKQQGTFSYYTRYAPYLQYLTIDEDVDEYIDALDLMCQNTDITIDGEVTNVYAGNQFTLYIPSQYHGYSANGTGGYAGQFSISSLRPMISDIEITEVMSDIEVSQLADMQTFIDNNTFDDNEWNLVSMYLEYEDADKGYFSYDYSYYEDDYYENDIDYEETIYVYVNQGYTTSTKYNYTNPYPYEYMPDLVTSGFDNVEAQIVEALMGLAEDEDENYTDDTFEEDDDLDIIDPKSYHKIWYILRNLDGFIIDTNIIEVADIVWGDSSSAGSAISYCPAYSSSEYVDAWYFGLIDLRPGQWASILTNSAYAYNIYGQVGSSTSTEILPYTPLLFNIFIEISDS